MKLREAGEVVAILAVVVSLLLLAYELKRSNDLAYSDALAFVHSQANTINQQVAADKELTRIWDAGFSDYESLSDPLERAQFLGLMTAVMNDIQVGYKYYEKGVIDIDDAEYLAQLLCRLMKSESTIRLWHEYKDYRIPGFYDFVNETCDLSIP